MSYTSREIKKTVKIHCINTKKFKTNLLALFITVPLKRETVTKNTLLPAVLKQGTKKLDSQEKINKELEDLYGATFDCGIDKIGDNQVIKFYMETLNDNFLPVKSEIMDKSINLLLDIILNPLCEDNKFKEEYVELEKENIKALIESKIDNKAQYALARCIEEVYKGKKYGLYKYGYVEDLKKITSENLYEYYQKLISKAKVDIFVSGDVKNEEVFNIIQQNSNISKLQDREDKHIINNETTEKKEEKEINIIEESMDITQGKLVIGIDVLNYEKDSKYETAIYNVILGESSTSKLFQNVREKASLAYTAGSNYVRQKNNIYIRCGIEFKNYEKVIEIIKQQLEDMKKGEFTNEDIDNAKKYMISGVKTIEDEQDSEITYYLGQEMSGNLVSFDQYIKNINEVNKEDIINIAKNIRINTIYFLKKLK